jgi:hypothetical protein
MDSDVHIPRGSITQDVRAFAAAILEQLAPIESSAGSSESKTSIDRRTLSYLKDKYQKGIADLTPAIDAIFAGSDRDERVLRQRGPTEERIHTLHELVSAVRTQQERIEPVGLP